MTEVAMRAVAVELSSVSKAFAGHVQAVDNVSLRVEPGELVTLLGPSGSGKTTLLRLIAGFEELTAGEILIDGVPVSGVPTHRRRLGMVAQDYALFPHMTVAENLAFGIRSSQRNWAGQTRPDRATVNADIDATLELVGLTSLRGRSPHQLSGGQKQRVALARALVTRPRILLLDEPFAALDKKMREQLQVEVRDLQQRVGITTVFVTHDQGEALSMSDRVAVLHDGQLEQYDEPRTIYDRPATRFVAGFIGRANFLTGTLVATVAPATTAPAGAPAAGAGRLGQVRLADGTLLVLPVADGVSAQSTVEVSVRPERLTVGRPGAAATDGANVLRGTVSHVVYLGDSAHVRVDTAAGELTVTVSTAAPLAGAVGDEVELAFAPDAATVVRG